MMHEWEEARLGTDSNGYTVDSLDAVRDASVRLAQDSRRELRVLTPDLEARVYDNAPFLDAVRSLALSGRGVRIRFLLRDGTAAIRHGHRLVELARHLTSFIEIRRVTAHHRDWPDAWLIADDRGVLHRPFADRYEGTLCFNAPLQAKHLGRDFQEAWEAGEPDPEMRRLHL